MFALDLRQQTKTPLTLLCLGAHSDDIEIGCGGLILDLLAHRRGVGVHWIVFSARAAREREARRSAALFLRGAARQRVVVHGFWDGFFPFDGGTIMKTIEVLNG